MIYNDSRIKKTAGPARTFQPVVYFIQQATMCGPVKIGYASHLAKRFSGLSGGCPTPLIVRAIIPAKNRELEMILQGRFDKYRMHHEWFDGRFAEDLDYFMDNARRLLAGYIEQTLPQVAAEILTENCILPIRLGPVQRAASGFDDHLIQFYPKPRKRLTTAHAPSASYGRSRKLFYT
jgi:hypothetical protein